jgi:hypothetical protein
LEVPAGGGAAIAFDPEANGISLSDPHGLAVDGAGDLFIADLGNGRVVKVPSGGGAATAIEPTVNGEGLRNPKDVAVNGAGDLFIADNVNHRVVRVPAGGGAATGLDPTLYFFGEGEVYGVAVDASGDLFIVQGGLEGGDNVVEEIQYSQTPRLNFPTSTEVGATDASDGVHTLQIVNIGNEALTLTALSYPADFSEASGDSNTCTGSTSLSPGQDCDVSVEFSPANIGALNESVTLTDNALNGNRAQQSIAVSGTGEEQSVISSPALGSTLPGPTVVFTWTSSIGATGYYLSLGSTGVGSQNVFNSGKRTVTSWTATGIPTNGEKIYARLTTYFGSVQMVADFTYTAATQAVLTAPAPGGLLPGTTATFTWKTGIGATGYSLWLGSTGVGSNNLYLGQETTPSAAVINLPTNGETIYARLYTNFNGVLSHVDYTYMATAQAVMISPTPGTLLPGSTITFTWTAGAGASGYTLWLGSTGAGSNNLYNSGLKTVTSVIPSGLPANLKPIYARLFTTINGVQVHADYTYTAQ